MSQPAPSRVPPARYCSYCLLLALALCNPGAFAQGAPETATQTSDEAAENVSFDVWEYRVAGNSLVENTAIERAVYPYLGPARTIDDVEKARNNLEQVFRDRGYGTVLVDIPEQDVVGGIVVLQVTEGKIGRLRVSGSRYFSLGRIKSKVPQLAEGSVPHLPTVQKELRAVNRATPDRRVTPVLKQGREPGTLQVDLNVKDENPLHASLQLNDRYSRDTTRTRLNANLSYSNLWQREHNFSLAYQVAPESRSEVEVFSGTYSMTVLDDKTLTLYGVRTNSDVATLGTLGVVGSGWIGGVRMTMPLPAIAGIYHSATLGFDYKDFEENIALLGADALNTPINYHMWNAVYSGSKFTDKATNRFSLGANFATRGLDNSAQEFADKRFKAKPNFVTFNASFSRLQQLPHEFSVLVAFNGQLAPAPVISNEQFAMGGWQSVRGYLESQQFVDSGVRGSIELRSPDLSGQWWQGLNDFRMHAFLDAGHGRILEALPGQQDAFTLAGTGLGFRLTALDQLNASLEWAVPLKENSNIDAGESRLHFTVGYGF